MPTANSPKPHRTTLYSNSETTHLGQIALIASIENGRGIIPPLPFRVYGSYAIVYITRGEGSYQDAHGGAHSIGPGSLICVYPELAHTYGPNPGQTWSEFYIVFRGPIFDSCRALGMLNAKNPVRHLEPADEWPARFRALIVPTPATEGERAGQVCRLLTLLTEIDASGTVVGQGDAESGFLTRACHLLSQDLSENLAVSVFAARAGLSYETFRKRFQAGVGMSAAQFRARRRIEAACDLLQYTSMTNAQIAEALGFSDEYHFSKRFKQLRSETPTRYRARFVIGRV